MYRREADSFSATKIWAKRTSSTWVMGTEPVNISITFIMFMNISSLAQSSHLTLHQKIDSYIFVHDDAFFQPELGWSVWGSLGWTESTGGLNRRMPGRLGWRVFRLQGRSQADTRLICRPCAVEPLDFRYCWSTGSGCCSFMQEEPEGGWVGEGFARGRSDA